MKNKKSFNWGDSTKAIHVGNEPDPVTGAIIPPIFQTSTYVQSSPGKHKGYEYSRTHNPTRDRLQECLAALEGGEFSVATASGLSASMLVMHLFPKGSKILCGDDVYGGTYRLFTTVFHDYHDFEFIDTTNLDLVEQKLKKHPTSLVWLETPTNPLLKITDLKSVTALAKKYGAKTLVDNTFMSPYFQKPLKWGADLVLHSMTKYLNGHSDAIGGCLIFNGTDLHQQLFRLQNSIGPCLSPFDSWLVLRGLKTLGIRMEAHQKNALALAKWLEGHKKIERVIYPGLASHPQHKIAKKQMIGFGGMITIFLKGTLKQSKSFLENVSLFALAESLGGVESLIEHPAIMTHASIPAAVRKGLGITDNLVRLSVGVENLPDLQTDLENALKNSL